MRSSCFVVALALIGGPGGAAAEPTGLGVHVVAGPSVPLWSEGSTFFFVDTTGELALSPRLALQVDWTFAFLRQREKGTDSDGAAQVHLLQPGLRYRLGDDDLRPYAAVGAGLLFSHGDLQIGGEDRSNDDSGFVLTARGGLEWMVAPAFALEAFAQVGYGTGVVTPADNYVSSDSVTFLLIGAGGAWLP